MPVPSFTTSPSVVFSRSPRIVSALSLSSAVSPTFVASPYPHAHVMVSPSTLRSAKLSFVAKVFVPVYVVTLLESVVPDSD